MFPFTPPRGVSLLRLLTRKPEPFREVMRKSRTTGNRALWEIGQWERRGGFEIQQIGRRNPTRLGIRYLGVVKRGSADVRSPTGRSCLVARDPSLVELTFTSPCSLAWRATMDP